MVYSSRAISWGQQTPRNVGRLRFIEIFCGGDINSPIVKGFDQYCRYVQIEPDQSLIATGEPIDKVFFLLSGALRLSVLTREGRTVALRDAHPGEILCEAVSSQNDIFLHSVDGAEVSIVASLGVTAFLELARADSRFLLLVLKKLAIRHALLIEQVVELSTLSMHARLHKELLRLCRDKVNADGSSTISPVPTHSELARRIGAQREAVSREMSHLQQLGIIARRSRNEFFVPSVSRLVDV